MSEESTERSLGRIEATLAALSSKLDRMGDATDRLEEKVDSHREATLSGFADVNQHLALGDQRFEEHVADNAAAHGRINDRITRLTGGTQLGAARRVPVSGPAEAGEDDHVTFWRRVGAGVGALIAGATAALAAFWDKLTDGG